MKLNSAVRFLIKTLLTVGIFVGIFAEFGGGPVPVSRAELTAGSVWENAKHAPLAAEQVCKTAAGEAVFARTAAGVKKIKALRHCENDVLTQVLPSADADAMVPLAQATGDTVYLQSQGFQLVPMDMHDLWREITSLDMAVFVPWFLFAMAIKLVGIFANILRWQVLLRGQGLQFGFGWLTASYFVGRYWGIVTPSTMGLDGWRLYDTIRVTRKPVECTTALAVERVIGLVGLLAVILMFMPFADLDGRNLADIVKAMALPIAAGVIFGVLLLLRPAAFGWTVKLLPHPKLRTFAQSAIDSATAYSTQRGALMLALGCAIFGQVTTMFMYFGNAMALQVEGVTMAQVLYASAVMTLGTFLAPSASGEGVRELVFVWLLGGHTTAAKAFLIGHLGFWIEKLPLSLPGGLVMLRAPEAYKRITQDDLRKLKEETAAESA